MRIYALLVLFAFSLPGYSQDIPDDATVSIIGTGDIMLGSNYPSAGKLPVSDGKELFRNVQDLLKDADVTFGNLEGCFLDKGGSAKSCKKGCYFFRMPDRYVDYLVEAGFDVMNIANNHNGDFGAQGRENTVKVLQAAGLNYAGLKDICETSRFEINGVKYGFCGFAPNSGTVKITNLEYARELVAGLKKDCDIVIVSFHGGAEGKAYNRVPRETESFYGENRGNVYAFAHAVIDAGADIVFGHGPHVVRAAELYKDRFIIYSLGNFCTAGEFSISGISGYAPIVKVYTDKQGKFVKGKIISALQKDKTGPVPDPGHSAAGEIKRLTELDFPETDLFISSDGNIEKKSDRKETGSVEQPENLLPVSERDSLFPAALAQNIIDYSRQFIGKPYSRGSKGPNAFDCSGFTSFIFKNFGYTLSAGCRTQVKEGKKVDKKELKTGDLIFFKGRNIQSSGVGHVGIVISKDEAGDVTFIHASRRGVRIDQLSASVYYNPRYVTGLRVL
jgi:cell wall-associated NlpC family hydrolase